MKIAISFILIIMFFVIVRQGDVKMPTGKIKWFNPTKGYGFINNDEGGKDVFVHISAVKESGIESLEEGDTVSFDVSENRGKENATNLKKV